MDAHGSGDGADGSGAYAVFARGGDGGFFKLGMVAEAEVVVGGEVDDLLAVVVTYGGLLVFEDAEFEEGSALLEVFDLGGEMSELGAGRGSAGHGCNRKPSGLRAVAVVRSASN